MFFWLLLESAPSLLPDNAGKASTCNTGRRKDWRKGRPVTLTEGGGGGGLPKSVVGIHGSWTRSVFKYEVHRNVYVPEAYLLHFTYHCWFINCSVQIHFVPLPLLMGANPLQVPLEGESRLFWIHSLAVILGPKKFSIFRATPSNGPGNRFVHIRIITSRAI